LPDELLDDLVVSWLGFSSNTNSILLIFFYSLCTE
jgi:hypothetical protein